MSTFFLVALLAGALIGLTIGMIILLILQIKNSTQVNKLTFPAYEYVVKQAEHKANEILAQAQKEARSVVASAETTGQKTVQEYTASATQAHEVYVETIEKFTKDLTNQLSEVAKVSTSELETLQASAVASVHAQQESISKQFEGLFHVVETTAETLETHTAQKITDMQKSIATVTEALTLKLQHEDVAYEKYIDEHLEKAVMVAEAEIAQYKKARLALLDTHIEKLVEDITARVLHKELAIADHADLARQALQEAKEHNVL